MTDDADRIVFISTLTMRDLIALRKAAKLVLETFDKPSRFRNGPGEYELELQRAYSKIIEKIEEG